MKKVTAISAILLASLAISTAAAQDHKLKADVPFGFYVGNTWAPPGTYIVSSDVSNRDMITIRSAQTKLAVISIGNDAENRSHRGALVFTKYGEQYFLHEVLSPTTAMNVELGKSKREKNALSHERADAGTPTNIYLALR
jgi:aspartokinase